MYAVVRTGGKQYQVAKGDEVIVEKLDGEEGAKITLDEVLLIGGEKTQIGQPLVEGAKVKAVIAKQFRDKKILVQHFKRRKTYQKINGHRQPYTKLKIVEISS